MRSKSTLFVAVLSCFFAAQNAAAYWGDEGDVSPEIVKYKTTFDVKADGKYVVTINQRARILDENARKTVSVQRIAFDKSRSRLRILKAMTIRDNERFPLALDKIEMKSQANGNGFEDMYQAMIPFEHATIGSILQLKYEIDYFAPCIPNYFGYHKGFESGGLLWSHAMIQIKSEIPLFTKFNDPTNSLHIDKDDSGPFSWTIRLVKPYARFLLGEPDDSYMEPAEQTYVSFSSEASFDRMGRYFGARYEQVLQSTLPEKLESIRLLCEKIEDETQQMNTAVSHVIEAIHYLGSWNTADGHLIPRPLDVISNTGYGDCKEYSVCLAAILRVLGHQAWPTLVETGEVYWAYDEPASMRQFNHAIVKAIGKSGKTYWIDPTNTVTMVGSIFPDIADRPALVLHAQMPNYEQIPSIDYRKSKTLRAESITLEQGGNRFKQLRQGTINDVGELALDNTGAIFSNPSSVVKNKFKQLLCDYQEPRTCTIHLPEERSREVKDLTIAYEIEEYTSLLRTNNGVGLLFSHDWATKYLELSENNQGAFFVGSPQTMSLDQIYKGMKADNLDSLCFEIHSPWVNAKCELIQTEEGIRRIETVEALKSHISSKDLKSEEFRTFKKQLEQNCNASAIIFSKH